MWIIRSIAFNACLMSAAASGEAKVGMAQVLVAVKREFDKLGRAASEELRWCGTQYPTQAEAQDADMSLSEYEDFVFGAGMLDRDNLLDIIRTFTLFSTNDKGEIIKVVGRYQQFRAVKLAVKRLLEGKTPRDRSGIIWHTQGSGKSLTMVMLARAIAGEANVLRGMVTDVVFQQDRFKVMFDNGLYVYLSEAPKIGSQLSVPVKIECLL